MIVFVDGEFAPNLSQLKELPDQLLKKTAPDEMQLTIPNQSSLFIHLIFNQRDATHHHRIVVGEGSELTLVEEYGGDANTAYTKRVTMDIITEDSATLHYYKIQRENKLATHVADISIQQKEASTVRTYAVTVGDSTTRETWHIKLQAPNADCQLNGFYVTQQDNQQITNIIEIDHQAPQGKSEIAYKGMADKKSSAQFYGKVIVRAAANNTKARQTHHHLLLSPTATIQTKPALEIYANEVNCTHGASVGELDPEALFYLQSRGIDANTAVNLLKQAFATFLLKRIPHADLNHRVCDLLHTAMA